MAADMRMPLSARTDRRAHRSSTLSGFRMAASAILPPLSARGPPSSATTQNDVDLGDAGRYMGAPDHQVKNRRGSQSGRRASQQEALEKIYGVSASEAMCRRSSQKDGMSRRSSQKGRLGSQQQAAVPPRVEAQGLDSPANAGGASRKPRPAATAPRQLPSLEASASREPGVAERSPQASARGWRPSVVKLQRGVAPLEVIEKAAGAASLDKQKRGATNSAYAQACADLRILPKFVRAVKDGVSEMEVDITGLSLGDPQLEALLRDKELVPSSNVVCWRMGDTRMSSRGLAALCQRLIWQTEVLDLPHNDFSPPDCFDPLVALLEECRLPRLRFLDLSDTGLTSIDSLARGLKEAVYLVRLELNHNVLRDGSPIESLIEDHPALVRLGLSANRLGGKGMSDVCNGLLSNCRNDGKLADVDLSWNTIDKPYGHLAAEALAMVLAESTTLFHLDLSYIGFDSACCSAIARGLVDNHHLYGLHLVGNAALVDSDGFLQPTHKGLLTALPAGDPTSPTSLAERSVATSKAPAPRPRRRLGSQDPSAAGADAEPAAKSPSKARKQNRSDEDILRDRDLFEQQSTCWACEGWTRIDLAWVVPEGEPEPRAVWAYTSLDHFKSALRLPRADAGGRVRFAAARMVPGGCTLQIIYQVDSALRVPPGAEVQALKSPHRVTLRTCEELPTLTVNPQEGSEAVEEWANQNPSVAFSATACVHAPKRDYRTEAACAPCFGHRTIMLDGADGTPVQMLRKTETEHRMEMKEAEKGQVSFWSSHREESMELMEECLGLDWSRAKVGRIVKDADQRGVYELLVQNYRGFVAIYRWLSARGQTEATFGIHQIELSDFICRTELINGKVTRIADIDRLFIASRVANVEMKRGGTFTGKVEKWLVRHQFLEFLLRLANQRFFESGEAPNMIEAVRKTFACLNAEMASRLGELDDLMMKLNDYDSEEVFDHHAALLEAAYKRFSGRYMQPGGRPHMSHFEFQDLLDQADAFDEEFTRGLADYAFRLGMETCPEEVYSTKFQEMAMPEFHRALGAAVYLRRGGREGKLAKLIDDFFSRNLTAALSKTPRAKGASLRKV
mmetsp:Transcript_58573/g.169965  ORF Transcript_58573/g.169965 Transcript_58573/m.169965 type:complete len:1078 (-) Transcript_58573:662-3895(-)